MIDRASTDLRKHSLGTVVHRQDLTSDLWLIRVRPETEVAFNAGQYATLGLPRNGRILERPYSMVSSPDEAELEFFLERVPEGMLTPDLHALQVGAEVLVRPRAKGLFLRGAPLAPVPHVFVSTVTGIAPFLSLIRQRAEAGRADPEASMPPVLVLQGASRSAELGYADEVTALAAELPWLTYVPTVSRPWEDPDWTGEVGRVEDIVRKHADPAGAGPGSHVYLCGNPEMIENVRTIMRRRGVADSDIRIEEYWPGD